MQKPDLLFLAHRVPFPPNKGDKIRSYNMLVELSKTFNVHLGCFIDDKDDIGQADNLAPYCASIHAVWQSKFKAKIRGLKGFIRKQAITLPYYESESMQGWVKHIIRQHDIKRSLIFSACMAQFVTPYLNEMQHSVLDFVDVDSDKWRQYAAQKSKLKAWFFKREARLLAEYEAEMAACFDFSTLVSEDEASLFKSQLPDQLHHKVLGIRNGVDTTFFNPENELPVVADLTPRDIVFTGAMDYWANVNAVLWFVAKVWRAIRKEHAGSYLWIVGANPSAEIWALNNKHNIRVTGRVADVRPYLSQAAVSVAPLQIARGIQNKVLEAMAMAKPVVLTHMAAEGIQTQSHSAYQVIDDPLEMAQAVADLLTNRVTQSPQNRAFVQAHFSWQREVHIFTRMLLGELGDS